MPTQTAPKRTAYYVVGDTAPPYRVRLEEDDGSPIDLTDAASAVINIAYSRWSYFYAPFKKIVSAFAVTIDADQVNNKGFVDYNPAVGHFFIAGTFYASFKVTWNDGTVQTVPSNTYLPIVVTSDVGGAP